MMHTKSPRAFTLIELLLVLVILAVLASVATPVYLNYANNARINGTIAEISSIKSALGTFELHNGRYPTTEEGLDALLQAPADLTATWDGPYIDFVPEDKFGHAYQYASPGNEDPTSFDITSAGKDGVFGTGDDITKRGVRS